MKKVISILICMLFLPVWAAAEQKVELPGSRYVIDVPDWMEYSDPVDGNTGVDAYVSKDLEMDYFSYRKEEAVQLGMADTLRKTAEERAASGADVELRKVNGIEMLCFRLTDDEDGAPCIGYVFEDGDMLIEIDFWYATQEAADETVRIMETIRKKKSSKGSSAGLASKALDHAMTLLEEGNPFQERYSKITGKDVHARMPQGVPYFWGARAESHTFAKEPDYIVQAAWQNSPAYYKAGTKYLYGFDCVGFVGWVWKQAYGTEMPSMTELFADRENHIRNAQTAKSPLWKNFAKKLKTGDMLLLEHDGRHIAIYAGTLRMYGYTKKEIPELAKELDSPLVIHCTVNAQISDRFAELIKTGLPKYRAATVTDGGVCVSLLVSNYNGVPGYVHQQNQDTRYYVLPDGTWLTVLCCGDATDFCWYRAPANP